MLKMWSIHNAFSLVLVFLAFTALLFIPYYSPTARSPSVYDYYWFKEGAYFVYKVEFPVPLNVFRFSDRKVVGSIDGYYINWSIVKIEGDWFYVNYTVILKPGVEEIVLNRVIKVNSRTLEAYVKPFAEEHPLVREHYYAITKFPRIDTEYVWLAEFPFILRAGAEVKFLTSLGGRGPCSSLFFSYGPEAFENYEEFLRVVERIEEFTTNMSRLLQKYPYWSGKNYRELAFIRAGDTFLYVPCNIKWGGGFGTELSITALKLEKPPSETGYRYGRIDINTDRIARANYSLVDASTMVKWLREWSSLHVDEIVVDPIEDVVVVLDNGAVLCVYPKTTPILPAPFKKPPYLTNSVIGMYDMTTGILLLLEGIEAYYIEHLLYIADMMIHKDIRIDYISLRGKLLSGEGTVRVRLVDSNISFERPVIGVKPPLQQVTTPPSEELPRFVEPPGLVTVPPAELLRRRQEIDLGVLVAVAVVAISVATVVVVQKLKK